MKWVLHGIVGTLLTASTTIAFAAFHLFTIEEVYSNADGTVQFIVLTSPSDSEDKWAGRTISAQSGGVVNSYEFPKNLPNGGTAGSRVLVATTGFANLGIVKPDFVVPNNFIPLSGGVIDYAGVYAVFYKAGEIPTDGVNALYTTTGVGKNLATNFAGDSASVSGSGPPPPAAANYQGLWYKAPAESESGWGINFAHQGDIIFATWFTYDAAGKAWWLTMTATKTGEGVYSGTLMRTNGTPFSAFVPPVTATAVGSGTLTFTSASTGTFSYTVNDGANVATQAKAIVPQVFATRPTCAWGAQADLTQATNYQDLWWATGGSESGWGVNLTHQGTTIFATWFTYDANHNPLWLSGVMSQTGPKTYTGSLVLTSGQAFNAVPFDPTKITRTTVGTATFTFTNGNTGTFSYNVDLGDGVNKANQTKSVTRQVFRAPGTVCN